MLSYYAGHGITCAGEVRIVPTTGKGFYNLERTLNIIAKLSKNVFVYAMYDCCRTNRDVRGGPAEQEDERLEEELGAPELLDDSHCRLKMITTYSCDPGSVARGESKMASGLFERITTDGIMSPDYVNLTRAV